MENVKQDNKGEDLNALLASPIKKNQINQPKKETVENVTETKVSEQDTKKKETQNFIDENRLVIGVNDKNKDLFIPEKSRFLNTIILGTKGTGKTTSVLPMFVEQDLKRKNAGVTIISSSKEMSYNLYSLAKKYKRKIHFIKPSINNEVTNKFLWLQDYNYDYINENIINYKEAIKKKEVIIIDMELMKYKSDALKSVAMLLLQLRLDIQETDITQRCHHFLYVDDAYNYLKFLEDLLIFSDNFNLGITLFMQSRNQFITKNKDYSSLINNNIRNTLLLNNITMEDYLYYKDKFSDKTINDFFNREFNSMLYETIDSMGIRRVGIAKFKKLLIGDWDELEAKSKRIRASLLKDKRKERELELREKYKKSLEINKPTIVTETNSPKITESSIHTLKEETKTLNPVPTKEPKPLDQNFMKSLTTPQGQVIKPREINIKTKEKPKQDVISGTKPNFNPPKTNYDLALEQDKKHKTISLLDSMADLGSIKPKTKTDTPIQKIENKKEQNNEQNKINTIKNQENKIQHNKSIKNTNEESKQTQEQKEDINNKLLSIMKDNPNKPVSLNKEKISNENIKKENSLEKKETLKTDEIVTENKPNAIEIQKQKEIETIKIQKEIEEKIQEQILNEEKERKRLVATRIFNNYNENIDYCDEIFDFKYD